MYILIEEYPYDVDDIRDVIKGLDVLESVEGKVSIHYVGYFFNVKLRDCVFILPKVMLEDVDGRELVFGKYEPREIIDFKSNKSFREKAEEEFIYKFAVWIYRAIVVYRNDNRNDSGIIYQKVITPPRNGGSRQSNTFLDILLALIQFHKDNQNFFFFLLKNQHSGFNKINWIKTIAKTPAIVDENNVVYTRPINKKRIVNFDEELLVIFYSILNFISKTYGFELRFEINFPLIRGQEFERYCSGFGITRLRQIKYKYFSDKALQLWNLCFAFFDESRQIFINTNLKEYLLVKSFHIVFEAIIDTLIGDNPLPDGMDKRQEDGKIVDHIYTATSLIENQHEKTYYIGDSKYYKMGNSLGSLSIGKQYTYAKNVIQWNLDIFNGENRNRKNAEVKLRDEETEGYNIIPNFFISARMDEHFRYERDGIEERVDQQSRHKSYQFKNRLFDRDTLLLFHYDVNFLFVLALYAKNNAESRAAWKEKIRAKFRETMQSWLQSGFSFYAMKARAGINTSAYIRQHFKEVIGKVYSPFVDKGILSLALSNESDMKKENSELLDELKKSFYIAKYTLGEDPNIELERVVSDDSTIACIPGRNGVLVVSWDSPGALTSKSFLHKKVSVGIKTTKDSLEVLQNIALLGFVLFSSPVSGEMQLYRLKEGSSLVTNEGIDRKSLKVFDDCEFYLSFEIEGDKLDLSNTNRKLLFSASSKGVRYTTIENIAS